MQLIRLNLVFIFSITIHLVSAQSIEIPESPPVPIRVVVIGSSTAAGTGASIPDSAWVNRYRQFLQKSNPENTVFNLARGGYQTYHLMPSDIKPPRKRPEPDTLRNITKALALRPDAIIINLPSNDAADGYPPLEQLSNFDTIVGRANAAGVPVWVCSTQPRNFSSDRVITQLIVRDSIFQRYGDFAINFWEGPANPNGLINVHFDSGDGIHLNDAGHRLLFFRVAEKDIPELLQNLPQEVNSTESIAYDTTSVYQPTIRLVQTSDSLIIRIERSLAPEITGKTQVGLALNFSEDTIPTVLVEITDKHGRVIKQENGNLPLGLKSNFAPPGIYRIEVKGPNFSKTFRWIRNR